MSACTTGFHYGKHHKAYVNNLNKLVAGTEYAALSLATIIAAAAGQSEKSAIFNNAAQIWTHILSAKNGKAVAKATLKTKKRAVECVRPEPLVQEGSETRDDGEADNEHFDGKTIKYIASVFNNSRQNGVTNKGDRS